MPPSNDGQVTKIGVQRSARSVLFTVLADLVYPDPKPVWTASLLYVMKLSGVSEPAARQAIARAAAADWLTAERRGRETRWSLGQTLIGVFEEGAVRVYGFTTDPSTWDGRWLVVVTTIPNERRTVRKKLYGALRWAGLGNPMPGVWVTPHTDRLGEVAQAIDEAGLKGSTVCFVGTPAAVGLTQDEIIRRSWDLPRVEASYNEMLERFTRLPPATGDDMVLAHLELTDAVRRLPFMDPQLPEALLPDWIGREATRRLRELAAAWSDEAQAHWRAIVESTQPG